MAEQEERRELATRPAAPLPAVQGQVVRVLRLDQQDELDLTNLDPRQQAALEVKAAEKAIDRHDRRQRQKDDLAVTAAQLAIFTKAVGDATAQNAAATVTSAKDDSLGRTEMILGNSDAAHHGKLSRSQQGLGENPRFWLALAAIAGVAVVLVAALRH